jgi:ATP-dependent protease ClpP protease subunit
MNKHWIRFTADINQKSFDRLAAALDAAIASQASKAVILMTSGGGVTKLGSATFNLLATAPIETTIYNMGHVESAGVAAFAGGTHRFAVPTAKFLIHKASWHLNERLTRDQLAEKVAILDREHEDYFQIFSGIFSCEHSEIHEFLRVGRVFASEQAKSIGLIHDIQMPAIPKGCRIAAIINN